MKRAFPASFLFIASTLAVIYACNKSKTTEPVNTIDPVNEMLSAARKNQQQLQCTHAPDYGSAVICATWKGPHNDYTVKPKKNLGPGKFFARPGGMVIDEQSGEINVTRSETGMRYMVGFVPAGATDTCFTELILSGVTYLDGVYVLENNDTLVFPHFDANPVPTTLCDPSDDTDYPGNGNPGGGGNNACEFDDGADDDNNNGPWDEPPPGQRANDQKVRVRTKNGVINLKKTLEDGAFGSNPQNGATKLVTIYYRLNDCSGKALQKICVKLIYYESVSDIPVELMSQVTESRTSYLDARIIDPYGKPRPPQIIVTSYAY